MVLLGTHLVYLKVSHLLVFEHLDLNVLGKLYLFLDYLVQEFLMLQRYLQILVQNFLFYVLLQVLFFYYLEVYIESTILDLRLAFFSILSKASITVFPVTIISFGFLFFEVVVC